MTKRIKTLLTLASLLFVTQFSFADATEDLWKALKEANYPNALIAIAAGADVKSLDPAFGTPLNFAACWADATVVKALIDAKSEVNFIAPVNGNNPLLNAAAWGNLDVFKLLLAAGGDVKIKTKIGQSFLAAAIMGGCNLEIIKLIVDAGADPNEKYDIMAVKDLTLMNALIDAKDPKQKVVFIQTTSTAMSKMGVTFPDKLKNAKESDFTPLEDIAKYLLDKGADPNQKVLGTWGSILFQATEFGKTGIVLALINAKANLEVRGLIYGSEERLFQVTSVMVASLKGNNEMVEAFCKAGAHLNFVAILMDRGATLDAGTQRTTYWKTTKRNTAVSLANDNGHPDTVALLRKYGGLGPKEIK